MLSWTCKNKYKFATVRHDKQSDAYRKCETGLTFATLSFLTNYILSESGRCQHSPIMPEVVRSRLATSLGNIIHTMCTRPNPYCVWSIRSIWCFAITHRCWSLTTDVMLTSGRDRDKYISQEHLYWGTFLTSYCEEVGEVGGFTSEEMWGVLVLATLWTY